MASNDIVINERSVFIQNVEQVAKSLYTWEQGLKSIGSVNHIYRMHNGVMTLTCSGDMACWYICVLEKMTHLFVSKKITVNTKNGDKSLVKFYSDLRKVLIQLMGQTAEILSGKKASTPLWMIEITHNTIKNFLLKIDDLFANAALNDTIVRTEQKRIMMEKADLLIKSPYFLELGSIIMNPAHFASGWFEKNGLLDEGILCY